MKQSRKIDSVLIEQLELDCVIGVNPWERLVKQRITIDITMDIDLSAAGKSDSIRDTVDYSRVVKTVTAEVNSSSYRLVEALATRVAEICLEPERVRSVVITLRKPGAVKSATAVGVTIRRSR